ILLCGGAILLCNISIELYKSIQDVQNEQKIKMCSFLRAMVQVIFLDIIFSLDSLITAIGISNNFIIMMISVIIAVLVMMLSSELIGNYIHRYPFIKVLALFFLFLIGCKLVLEGFHVYISQNYIYFLIVACGLLKIFHLTYHQK
ncbi:TerC family protein, partial [Candidatus Erwinia haradaeae]